MSARYCSLLLPRQLGWAPVLSLLLCSPEKVSSRRDTHCQLPSPWHTFCLRSGRLLQETRAAANLILISVRCVLGRSAPTARARGYWQPACSRRATLHCQVIIIVQCCRYRLAAATDTDRQSVLSVLSVYYLRRPWAQSLVLTTGVSDRTMRRRPAFSCAVRHGSRSRGGPGHAGQRRDPGEINELQHGPTLIHGAGCLVCVCRDVCIYTISTQYSLHIS